MNITKVTLGRMFLHAAGLLTQEASHLSEIDSRFGDGDHGVAVKKIAAAFCAAVENDHNPSLKSWIDRLGTVLMSMGGGSAGPLWGTFISGLALPLSDDAAEIDAEMLKRMFAAALDEMESVSSARVGDKTLMDTLIPAVQAAQTAGGSVIDVLDAAAAAAWQGAQDTERYVARYGRAKHYKEQTIGTPDAGAVGLMVFFKGLALGAKESPRISVQEGVGNEDEKVH